MSNENQDNYYPISVLIDELRNEDIHARMNSIKHLSTIALALGPEKTRSQLIPFLTDSIYDEEDVLISLTDEFIKLIDYVGGLKYVHVLLQPLETFAAVEESVVREKGVQVLRKIAFYHSQDDIREHYFPLVERYGNSHWFGTKCSAVSLFPVIYPRVDASKKEKILEMLNKIINDEVPMVRKAAATRIGELVTVMLGKLTPRELVNDLPMNLDVNQDQNKENLDTFTNPEGYSYENEMEKFKTSLIPLIKKLWSDKQEPVRLAILQSVIDITCAISQEEIDDIPSLKEIIIEAVNDNSWRGRCLVADRFPAIIKSFSQSSRLELTCLFTKLLRDEEAEVRLISLNKSKSIAYYLVGKTYILPDSDSTNEQKDLYKNDFEIANGTNNRIIFNSDNPLANTGSGLDNSQNFNGSNNILSMINNEQANSNESSEDHDQKFSSNLLQKKMTLINNFVNFDSISLGDVDHLIFQINPYENAIALKEYKNKVADTKEIRTIEFNPDGQVKILNDKMMAQLDEDNSKKSDNEEEFSEGQEIIVKNLIPSLLELSSDGTILIRIGLANSIMSILPLLPKESIQHFLLPTIMNQLSDTNSDVRLNLISRFEYLKDVIGIQEFFNKLIPAIETLAKDKKWRIRLGVMNYVLLLAEKFGTKIFSESLVSVSINFLYDTSYAIRLAAVTNLTKLGIIFGSEWAYNILLPSILKDLSKEENYLFRMMCLEAIISFIEVIDAPKVMLESLLEDTLKFSNDVIPNVRFKAAQTLSRLGLKLSESNVQSKLLPRLREMLKDSDSDVVYFANEAIFSLTGKDGLDTINKSEPAALISVVSANIEPSVEPMETNTSS